MVVMEQLNVKLDWLHWYERWEAMMNSYAPHRYHRFGLMLDVADFRDEDEARIVDLGCGPGSLAFRASERFPNAQVTAVEFDPVLLAIGRGVAANRVRFLQADLRDGGWWNEFEGGLDLVVSATALHWLNAEHHAELYRRIYSALKPGGRFANADHMAADDPEMQDRFRSSLGEKQNALFKRSGAEKWNDFWESIGEELRSKGCEIDKLRCVDDFWEGTDDGQPFSLHLPSLKECGFEEVRVHWQDEGEAIIGAKKPS